MTSRFGETICLRKRFTDEYYLVRMDTDEEYIYAAGPLTRKECDYCHDEAGGLFSGTYDLAITIALNHNAYSRVW